VSGRVVLVGAGPGDPDLLTQRAVREIRTAEVLLYDALIAPIILGLASPECERIDVGKRGDGAKGVPQDEIAELMLRKAREGKYVVRLKGGDPFVFGRGGEEASALAEAGIPFEIVPGISSAVAVPAYAGIPLTDRGCSSSVAIVTGHRGKSVEDQHIDWEGLARSVDTLVVLMGTAWVENIVERVIGGGRDPETPAAAIASGTTPQQRVVSAPLRELPGRIREAGLRAPTVILIGEIVRSRETLAWFEKRPLFGRRVLVLRAEGQQAELCELLLRSGAEPVRVPLLGFKPACEPQRLADALESAESYDWLVFTSANAVRFSLPFLARDALSIPRVACIGPATAEAARAAGLRVQIVPERRFLPEELAAEMADRWPLRGARVLFPRAERANDTLVRALEREGASVESVEAYRTFLPTGAEATLRSAIKDGLDAVLLTSPSTVDHLFSLLGEREVRDLAKNLTVACIGPSTAGHLCESGIEPEIVCERQSAEALVEALERWFSEHGHGVS